MFFGDLFLTYWSNNYISLFFPFLPSVPHHAPSFFSGNHSLIQRRKLLSAISKVALVFTATSFPYRMEFAKPKSDFWRHNKYSKEKSLKICIRHSDDWRTERNSPRTPNRKWRQCPALERRLFSCTTTETRPISVLETRTQVTFQAKIAQRHVDTFLTWRGLGAYKNHFLTLLNNIYCPHVVL